MDTDQPMGEFTKKFEREILGHDVPDAPEDAEAKVGKSLKEIRKLYNLILERRDWLRQRFSNISEEEIDEETAAGLRCRFEKDADHPNEGRLEFHCRDNETHQAIFLECTVEIEGQQPSNDYVSFPVDRVNEARAKKFIQDKIFAFAKAYLAKPEESAE
ncbi:MAG: hypothetical protein E3J72_13795 [Planctomycetota bacterium]|nr:MAG: hypothetical protein E3J72_13795 [Planctomycetota bacterium]